ncbi:MAG: PIN domain-containing protein [Rhodospirillales bacterium]|nr:PIN domain-containing protein [Rhodospirillales bacterium]
MYLIDTNVLSAAAPNRKTRFTPLLEWINANSDHLFLSVITVAEIYDGIAKARRTGPRATADKLEHRIGLTLHLYAQRVLPFDIPAARLAGTLNDRARAAGQAPGFADVAIAATAANRNLIVLTRNLRHFTPLQIPALDPFQALPDSPRNA